MSKIWLPTCLSMLLLALTAHDAGAEEEHRHFIGRAAFCTGTLQGMINQYSKVRHECATTPNKSSEDAKICIEAQHDWTLFSMRSQRYRDFLGALSDRPDVQNQSAQLVNFADAVERGQIASRKWFDRSVSVVHSSCYNGCPSANGTKPLLTVYWSCVSSCIGKTDAEFADVLQCAYLPDRLPY